jgi:hypothetical protein
VKQEEHRNQLDVENFDSSKVQITTPDEIKPEVMRTEDQIDVNSLEEYKLSPLLQDSLIKNNVTKLT